MRIGNKKNPVSAFCRTPLRGMQVQILSLRPLIFPRSYQWALTFQDHRLVYLALLIRLSFDDSRENTTISHFVPCLFSLAILEYPSQRDAHSKTTVRYRNSCDLADASQESYRSVWRKSSHSQARSRMNNLSRSMKLLSKWSR